MLPFVVLSRLLVAVDLDNLERILLLLVHQICETNLAGVTLLHSLSVVVMNVPLMPRKCSTDEGNWSVELRVPSTSLFHMFFSHTSVFTSTFSF